MVDVYFLRTERIDFVHYSSDELGVFLNKKMIFKKQKKNVSRTRKKTFYIQFCMGTPEGHQKSMFSSKVKKTNI
jgi:hypothetical protein